MNFKSHQYDSLVLILLVAVIASFAWFIIRQSRDGLSAGPGICLNSPNFITVKKPVASTILTAGIPYKIRWVQCHAPGPFTVKLFHSDGTSPIIMGVAPGAADVTLDVTIPTTTPAGNYYFTVTAANGTIGTSETFTLDSTFIATPTPTCTLDASNPDGTGDTRYCDVIFDDAHISMSTVEYATAPSLAGSGNDHLMMDIYTPMNDTVTSGRPYVLFAHAGGGQRGDGQPSDICKQFTGRGYVCASIDYRGTDTAGGFTGYNQKIAQSDIHAANGYFRAHASLYGVDPNKAIFAGVSAGAITAVQGGISGNNTSDSYFDDPKVNTANSSQPSWACYVYSQSGSANSAVLNMLDAADPAVAFYHGELDTTVLFANAVATKDAMTALGIPSTMLSFPDAGHKVGHASEIYADFFPKAFDWVITQGCPHTYMNQNHISF